MKKRILIYIILLFVLAGCKKPNETIEDDANFCSCLNTESMDKTIPFVDEFLAGLHEDMEDEKKLEDLITWFNAQPCIQDAAVYCQSCIQSQPPSSKIAFSFDENGKTKEYILDVSMTRPLKAMEYHAPVEIPSWDYFLHDNWIWCWDDRIPSKVIVLNSNDELVKYLTGSPIPIYWKFPLVDFSEHSLILVSGTQSNKLGVSDITGSLQQHGDLYMLHIEISLNEGKPQQWFYAMVTSKLSNDSRIETVVSYCEYEGDNYYYSQGEKVFLQQRADKIFLQIMPDTGIEKIQAIINSDASLRLVFNERWEEYYLPGWETCISLETKDGSRIPKSTLESFKAREEVVWATGFFSFSNSRPVAPANNIIFRLNGSHEPLMEVIEKYGCFIGGKYNYLYVPKISQLNTLQIANFLYETGQFDYAEPNLVNTISPAQQLFYSMSLNNSKLPALRDELQRYQHQRNGTLRWH